MKASKPITLFVGLGNPTLAYTHTRHNMGQDWLMRLCERHNIVLKEDKRFMGWYGQGVLLGKKIHCLIPTTYMNVSGRSVLACCAYYKIDYEQILVAHDELDLPPGQARFKFGGGHGGHNGLRDIINKGSNDRNFYRLRLGIGHPGHASMVSDYVLSRAPTDQRQLALEAIEQVDNSLIDILEGRWQIAMQTLHSHNIEQ